MKIYLKKVKNNLEHYGPCVKSETEKCFFYNNKKYFCEDMDVNCMDYNIQYIYIQVPPPTKNKS